MYSLHIKAEFVQICIWAIPRELVHDIKNIFSWFVLSSSYILLEHTLNFSDHYLLSRCAWLKVRLFLPILFSQLRTVFSINSKFFAFDWKAHSGNDETQWLNWNPYQSCGMTKITKKSDFNFELWRRGCVTT